MLSRALAIGMSMDAFWGISLRAAMLLWERSVGREAPDDGGDGQQRATHNAADLPM